MNRHSDVDLLMSSRKVRNPTAVLAGRIYEEPVRRCGAPVDVVVVTPADVARYKDSHALVIKPALQEGRVIYEAA